MVHPRYSRESIQVRIRCFGRVPYIALARPTRKRLTPPRDRPRIAVPRAGGGTVASHLSGKCFRKMFAEDVSRAGFCTSPVPVCRMPDGPPGRGAGKLSHQFMHVPPRCVTVFCRHL
jgi:hypothetical protein